MRSIRVGPPAGPLRGRLHVPGDKSIAHRALLIGALADGDVTARNVPGGGDVTATLGAIRALGVDAVRDGDTVRVRGAGRTLAADRRVTIDCGNSGTTMRLLAGVVAGVPCAVTLDGDASLRRRPMERVAAPLREMGASVGTTDGRPPVRVEGAALRGIEWTLPVASAQVKSAVLLAGLRAHGTTTVREPLASRDHTERMLTAMGVPIERLGTAVRIRGGGMPRAIDVAVPGDVSSALFVVVAALVVPGSDVTLEGVGLNPTRTGALAVLRRMGADLTVRVRGDEGGEPRGDLRARASRLQGVRIAPDEVPAAIDELPILLVAAAFAAGDTEVAGAAELRVKESDRLAALEQLALLGVPVEVRPDGMRVTGSGGHALRGAAVRTHGDHRIAMAFAVAGLHTDDGVAIDDADCAAVSYPGFFEALGHLARGGA